MDEITTAAAARLIEIGLEDTNQSKRVRDFILAWWNCPTWGGFDPITLTNVDQKIADDMMTVMAMLSRSGSAVYPEEFKPKIIELQQWRKGPSGFADFHDGVAARAYQLLTGMDPGKLTSWADLEQSLDAFGNSASAARTKLDTSAKLTSVGPFSATEELVAIPMLMRAHLQHLAHKFAAEGGWWNRYGEADERTRRVIGCLLKTS